MKKKGIIERLVMGKKRDKDLTENDLPSTRFKQFAFVFRTRFGVIFRLNLISALFFLPFMAWDILAGGYAADFVAGMTAEEQLEKIGHGMHGLVDFASYLSYALAVRYRNTAVNARFFWACGYLLCRTAGVLGTVGKNFCRLRQRA